MAGSKPWLYPAPTYRTLESYWDTDDDAPGPRCGHTLTAIAPTKTHGPRLILFGGLAGVTNSVHSYDVLTRKWTRLRPAGEPPSVRAAHAAAAVGTMVVFQNNEERKENENFEPYVLQFLEMIKKMDLNKPHWLSCAKLSGGPAGHSTDDLYVLDLTNDKYKWHRVVVQGQGPGPRYGHVIDLVAQRYLVTVSGNDGRAFLF
ncbi:Serine/threonine-protein phosphatase BSL1 [Vitis vinifera]|uniref:Serine/threonine-protein phosphatase BSL1 n=1 Tax=Vitis vinifera TaxID=29760 RepID=A0A438KH39_VITVI|nr:Serine/threonine-protein phosphatase BSL1 [Vitis vinifera]